MPKFGWMLVGAAFLTGACTATSDTGLQAGLVAIHEARYTEAEKHFAGMLGSDGGDPYAWLNLGVAQAQLGKKLEAGQSYRKAIQLGENAPVRSVVMYQGGQDIESTVAAVASANLEKLGGQ